MPAKTITIREDVYYLKLKKLKKPEESFSDLLVRLAEKEQSLVAFLRAKGSLDFGEDTKDILRKSMSEEKI